MRWWQRLLLGLAGLALIACGIGWTALCRCSDKHSSAKDSEIP